MYICSARMWCGRCAFFARPVAINLSAAAAATTCAHSTSSARCEQHAPDASVAKNPSGLGGYGLRDIPSKAYKAHFSEAYNAAAAKNAANVAQRHTDSGAEPEADRRVRLGIARHLMMKLGYTSEELDLIGEDVLRMQGVKSPFDAADLRPGERVLDLGSGFGSDAFLAVAKVGPHGFVTGIDLSAEEVRKASNRAQERGFQPSRCRFLEADMESLPIEAETVDVVISNGGFCLCPNKRTSFQEVHRVLRPGGRIAISCTVLRKELPSLQDRRWPPCMEVFMPWRDIEGTLQAIGFQNVFVDGSNSLMNVWDLDDQDVDNVAGHLSTPLSAAMGCSHARKAEEKRAKEAVDTYLSRDREAGIHHNSPEFAHIKDFDMNALCARVTIYAEKAVEKD